MRYSYLTPEERVHRWIIVLLAIVSLVLAIFLCTNNCSSKKTQSDSWYFPEDSSADSSDIEPSSPIGKIIEQPSLGIKNTAGNVARVEVASHERYEDVVCRRWPEFEILKSGNGLGGAKLIGEMSADVCDIYVSQSIESSLFIIFSYNFLGLMIDSSCTSPYKNVADRKLRISGGRIESVFSLFDRYSTFLVMFAFENLTGQELSICIKQGQMLEVDGSGVQNLVVDKSASFSLAAYENRRIQVSALCASHHRENPTGFVATFTPFVMSAGAEVYSSQETLWAYQEKIYQNLKIRYGH